MHERQPFELIMTELYLTAIVVYRQRAWTEIEQ